VKACEVLGPTTAIHCQGAFYSGPGATVAIRRATPIELDDIARQLDKAADTAFEVLERDLEFERRRRDRTIQSLTEAEQAELQRMLDEANARAEYAASAEGKLDRLIKLQERSIELNEQAAHEKSR
jgi:hypothetical protein